MHILQLLCLLIVVTADDDPYHSSRSGGPLSSKSINPAERTAQYWYEEAQMNIQKRLSQKQNKNAARNVILFLGDGMSIPTLVAARTLKEQRENRTEGRGQLFFENFPTLGLAKTYCLNRQVPDSACTATAYLCGVKNNYGTIGVTGDVPRRDCEASRDTSRHLESIAAWALADGRDAGIVTTTRVTHASPAGAYARTADRGWEDDTDVMEDGVDPSMCPDITHQLVHTSPGNQFKVILGGGRRTFLPSSTTDEEGNTGRRSDGRNLIEEWEKDKNSRNASYQYIWNRSQLMSVMNSPPEYLLGLFQSTHLPYHLRADKATKPTLAEMTETAIRSLNRNQKGFFLFVESGRIDHGHHDNYVELALDEAIEMDRAIERAIEILGDDEDTLIVVTADHAHVMAFNGYISRGADILGPSKDVDTDGVPYMTLSYANGPGARAQENGQRIDVTQDTNYREYTWRAHAEVPLSSETHGGDDVAVLATGPYHQMFSGVYEQTQIPRLMAYAACIGPGRTVCKEP